MAVKIDWTDPNYGEDGQKVYRSTSPMDPESLPTALATVAAGVETYTDATAIASTTYYYRVSAVFGIDEYVSDEVSILAT